MNFNSVTIAGRLTRDPEIKALPSGMTCTTFSLATSRKYKDTEETEYHNVVTFDKTAEACGKYLLKGQICLVTGRLATRSWDKDGVKMYRTEIIADRVEFGPKAGDVERVVTEPSEYPEEEINPEDIPF